MGRSKPRRGGRRRPVDPDEGLNLTENIQTRVSPQAEKLIKRRARLAGQTPSAWLRVKIYRILGLNKEE